MLFRVASAGLSVPLTPLTATPERCGLLRVVRPEQEAGKLVAKPIGGDCAAIVRFLPRRLIRLQQRLEEGLRMNAPYLLLGKYLPDCIE